MSDPLDRERLSAMREAHQPYSDERGTICVPCRAYWPCHASELLAKVDRLQEAASERDAIATLLSDRREAGPYAKVEGLLAEVDRLAVDAAAYHGARQDIRDLGARVAAVEIERDERRAEVDRLERINVEVTELLTSMQPEREIARLRAECDELRTQLKAGAVSVTALRQLPDLLNRLADRLRDTRWQPFQTRDEINMGMRDVADKLEALILAAERQEP